MTPTTRACGRRALIATAMPAERAPPPTGMTTVLDVGERSEDLQPARPVARDHGFVVVGGDEHGSGLFRPGEGRALGFVVGGSDEVQAHRVLAELGDLGGSGVLLDEELRPFDAERLAGVGDPERVVARGGGRRDRAGARPGASESSLLSGAAGLEGAGVLAVLLLQPEIDSRRPREQGRPLERRLPHVGGDARARRLDVMKGHAHSASSFPRRTTSRTRRSRSSRRVRWLVMQTRSA